MRAAEAFDKVLGEMGEQWPDRMHRMRKETYAKTLRSRLETLRAASAAAGRPEGDRP